MSILPRIAPVAWLGLVAFQAAAFMTLYGLLPLPPEFALLDLTPAWWLLGGLLGFVAVMMLIGKTFDE